MRGLANSIGKLPFGLQMLLAANLFYCLMAATTTLLPGWKMFSRIGAQDYELLGPNGRRIDLKTLLPRDAYALSEADFERVGCFAARRHFPGEVTRLVSSAGTKRLRQTEDSCEVVE